MNNDKMRILSKDISRRDFIRISAGAVCTFALGGLLSSPVKAAAQGDYKRLVVLADVHVPSGNEDQKLKVLNDINTWNDVHHVTVVGDVCVKHGNKEELDAAVNFMSNLKKPTYVLTGNHDYFYSDHSDGDVKVTAGSEERAFKLERFRKAFNMKALYLSEDLDNYHLVYLSPDNLESNYLTELSIEQLVWLEQDLAMNKNKPTIIFFHGSLEDTWGGNNLPGSPDFMVQPAAEINDLLAHNPQVFLWVSGHLHLAAFNKNCNDEKVYTYAQNNVKNIHNPALRGQGFLTENDPDGFKKYPTLWTDSLYLYSDRVVVRTYDHGTNLEVKELEKIIRLPVV